MRVVGLGVIGFLAGALLGLVLAYFAVVLLFDVLHIFDHGADGMSGLTAMVLMAPFLGLLLGAGGAILAIVQGRDRDGGILWMAIGGVIVMLGLFFMAALFGLVGLPF